MKKKIGVLAVALFLVATTVSAQDANPSKMKMLIGGELGYSVGTGKFDLEVSNIKVKVPFVYGAFDITPVFQFYPFKNEAIKDDLGFEIDARFAFGSNGWGTTFAMTPDFLVMYYFNKVPYVVPFVGAGVGIDLTFFSYPAAAYGEISGVKVPTGLTDKNYTAFRFDITFKAGAAFNIPNTKLQVYLTDKFRIAIPDGIINDINAGVLFRL